MRDGYPQLGEEVACDCVADTATIELIDGSKYSASFSGQMKVRVGEPFEREGHAVVPLVITGHSTAGHAEGLGRLTVDKDGDRDVAPSTLSELAVGEGFPAVQDMHVNILVTAPDLLPGVTLRNTESGVLRNAQQHSFPPRDAVYQLQAPLDLERIDEPGTILARILSYSARINPAD